MGDDHARSTIAGHAGVAHTVGPAVRTGPQEHAVTRRELLLLAEIIGAQDAERKARADQLRMRAEGRHARRVARDTARHAEGWTR
jgi:hypothetical protein